MNNHSLCVLYAHCGDRLHSLKELNIKLVGEVSDLKEVLSMADMYMEDSAETLEYFHLETPHLGLETLSSLNVFSFSIQATRIVIDRNQCDTEELIWGLSIFKGLSSQTQITELQLRIRVDGEVSGLQENLAALSLQSDIDARRSAVYHPGVDEDSRVLFNLERDSGEVPYFLPSTLIRYKLLP